MVLDPFCGCATTPVAAERLGRASLTLTGLIGRNRQDGFMVNQELATLAVSKARDATQRCRAEMR